MTPEVVRPVRVVARRPRGPFGRFAKGAFWAFQALMLLLLLGQCAFVLPHAASEDPEVAMGAGMFGALLGLGLWLAWPVGTALLGLVVLLTRGERVEVELPPGT